MRAIYTSIEGGLIDLDNLQPSYMLKHLFSIIEKKKIFTGKSIPISKLITVNTMLK